MSKPQIQTGNYRLAVFSEPMHITNDSHCCLRVNAVIAKEGIYDFPAGPNGENRRCLWSKRELLDAAPTARAAKLTILDHPPNRVVTSQDEMYGVVEKPFFDRDKIRAILNFDKTLCPPEFLKEIRKAEAKQGPPKDVSIGFYYDTDETPGTWHGKPYDLIMRNILIDHVAAGVWKGRCSWPNCGIGVARADVAAFTKSRAQKIGGKKLEMSQPEKDEHGCLIGKEEWNGTECVPKTSETAQDTPPADTPQLDEHGCKIGQEEWDGEKCVPLQPKEPKGPLDSPTSASEGESPTEGPEATPPDTNKGELDEHGCYIDSETWSEELGRCVPNRSEDGPTGEDHSNDPVTEATAMIKRSKRLLKLSTDRNIERLKAERRHPA